MQSWGCYTQVTSANLERSYRRAPKGAGEEGLEAAGAGICHLCMCGQGIDWENLTLVVHSFVFLNMCM